MKLKKDLRARLHTCLLTVATCAVPMLAHSDVGVLAAGQAAQVAFSPREGGEALVVRLIETARSSIRLAAYSFTSPVVTRALIAARKRGVDVAVLVDYKNNLVQDQSGKAVAVLNALSLSGVATATVGKYPIHHDKYIVVDATHVETGSFNFSSAAEFGNSENVLVLWNSPQVAKAYLAHWQSRSQQSERYQPSFAGSHRP